MENVDFTMVLGRFEGRRGGSRATKRSEAKAKRNKEARALGQQVVKRIKRPEL